MIHTHKNEITNVNNKKQLTNKMEVDKIKYFQIRESPAPLNIPTPTPAPDHPLGQLFFVFLASPHSYLLHAFFVYLDP